MSLAAISSSSVAAVYNQPSAAAARQPAKAPQQTAAKDTVSLSPQAQQLASDGDPAALEAQESASEKASEAMKGKA